MNVISKIKISYIQSILCIIELPVLENYDFTYFGQNCLEKLDILCAIYN